MSVKGLHGHPIRCMQTETTYAVLSASAAALGYSSWPHALVHLAKPLCIAWVSTGGSVLDLASSSYLLDLPTHASAVDTQGVTALMQTGLPDVMAAVYVPDSPPHEEPEGLLTDRDLFLGHAGLPNPRTLATGLLSTALMSTRLPEDTESLSTLDPAVLKEVQSCKAVCCSSSLACIFDHT
jgi:hypothetical protein